MFITIALIVLAGLCALVGSLFAMCKLGSHFGRLNRIDYVPHVWAFIAATATYSVCVCLALGAFGTYASTLLAVFVGCGCAFPALDYMWCQGHLPNSIED